MSLQNFISLMTLVSILNYSGVSQAKEYDCSSLSSLQTQIKKDSKDNSASVSAMKIRFMGRSPNPCVKNTLETSDAVEVSYLDKGTIISDIFNFSKDNQLVSMTREFSSGKIEIINF